MNTLQFTLPATDTIRWPDIPPSTYHYTHAIGNEVLPALLPQSRAIPVAYNAGLTAYDVFRATKDDYQETGDLCHTAYKAGESTVFEVLATILLPLLLIRPIHRTMKKWFSAPGGHPLLLKHANKLALLAALTAALLAARPLDYLAEAIMDRTWRRLPFAHNAHEPKTLADYPPLYRPELFQDTFRFN